MKTLEDHLNQAGEEIRQASNHMPPVRTPKSHPVRRGLIAAVGVALAAALLVMPVLLVNRPPIDPIAQTDVNPGETILMDNPLVVRGAPGPEPQFDTTSLGAEIQMAQPTGIEEILSRIEHLPGEEEVTKYIVAGRIENGAQAGILYAPGGLEWCLWVIPPSDALASCSGRRSSDESPVLALHPGSDTPDLTKKQNTLAWGPTPENTSVVTITYDETSLWQKPVGRVVLFSDVSIPDGEGLLLTALDHNGNVIHTLTYATSSTP